MADKFTGAHLCEFKFQCVTQPGVDPHRLYEEVMYAVRKICGSEAGVSTIGHDEEFKPTDITFRPMYVRDDAPWKEGKP